MKDGNYQLHNKIIGLIATSPRLGSLFSRALPSIKSQNYPLTELVIVCDRYTVSEQYKEKIRMLLSPIDIHILDNTGLPGAADSWNTGLKYIEDRWSNSYVAILDDDDTWDNHHLNTCWKIAQSNRYPDVIITGLRMFKDGIQIPRTLPENLKAEHFLVGNPGWQGSNTFIKVQTLRRAGRFTSGLVSTNDRDLAIRILQLEGLYIAYTRQFSANWFCGESDDALSAPESPQKLLGLAQFYYLHRHLMNSTRVEKQFFYRANHIFRFSKDLILSKVEELSESWTSLHAI